MTGHSVSSPPARTFDIEAKTRESVELQRELWPAFERTVGRVALAEEAQILARFASIGPESSVVEVGCGTGRLLSGISSLSRRVVGVDVLPQAVEASRRRGLTVVRSNGLALPFPDGAFDVAISNDVIHNLPPELTEPLLRELARVGRTVVLGAVRNQLAFFTDLGYLLLLARRGHRAEASAINSEVAWFGGLARVARRCGLAIEGLQASSHFQALYRQSSIPRRLYRVRPGNIGLLGWLLPRPYRWLQYDVLLRRS